MKTQQETRELLGLEFDMKDVEDFPVRIKIRKKRKNLPSLWDDICYSRRGDNWKHYRHTQHKEGRRKGGL
jgi:hypothetical protein